MLSLYLHVDALGTNKFGVLILPEAGTHRFVRTISYRTYDTYRYSDQNPTKQNPDVEGKFWQQRNLPILLCTNRVI